MKKLSILIGFLLLFASACSSQSPLQQSVPVASSDDVSKLNPGQIVTLYFQAWNNKQYYVMYSLISDGFKQIEPTAKTFNDFKSNMEKFYDTSLGIRPIEVKETYSNEKEAGVNYKIEITNKDNSKKEFSGTYTLKKRANGWKLIHPYGKNIDTT